MSNKNIAKINKGTLKFFIDSLNVPKVIISKKLGVKIEYIAQWIDVDSDIYPTINQAKNLALLLRVPFAGLYIAPENISKKDLPKV
ncbi:MAG: hypothetical protein MJ032_01330, partial [Acidaminococcaceae bacterium]|nr:hypothetical protein [Acidaminococcaceae bacterium]